MDTRETPTTAEADVHLAPKPGTNVAVLNGLLNLIIENGAIDAEYIARRTVGFENLKRTVAVYSAELVQSISDVPADLLRAAARLLGNAQSLISTVLQGVYQSMQATAAAVQVNNLNLILGMVGKPGAGILQMNGQPTSQNTRETGADGDLPGFRNWDNPAHIEQLARIWNVEPLKIPHWAPPTHALEIFRHAEQGSLRMLWIQCTNPAVSLPDLPRIRKILSDPNLFVVASDIFRTETTDLADVVLPAAAWGEKTGTFTNTDRTVHISHKAIDAPGEARSDFDIFLDYAQRMDFRDKDGQPLIKWHDPESAFEEWKKCSRGRPCDYTGLSYAKLSDGPGISWPCNDACPDGTTRLYEDGVFPTAAGQCETYGHDLKTGAVVTPEAYKANDPNGRAFLKAAEYQPPLEQPDSDFPFWVTTGRVVHHFHTRTKTGRSHELNKSAPDAYAQISAEDAGALGLNDGGWVRLESRRGYIDVPCRIGGITKGRVFIPFHYGYWDAPEHRRAANELTLFDWDAVSKQPHYKYAAVRISAINAPEPTQADRKAAEDTGVIALAKKAIAAVTDTLRPARAHLNEYIGLLDGSERALAEALERVAEAHREEPDVFNECRLLASWSRCETQTLRNLADRYGETTQAEPTRLGRAAAPQLKKSGFGLVRDLHDCWLLACESHMTLVILDQAAKGVNDSEMISMVERMDEANGRQRDWLQTRIKRAAPQALIVPI